MPSNNLFTDYTGNFVITWGIAAESTMEKNQRKLHVYAPEITPLRNGDVPNKGSTTTAVLFDVMTQSYQTREFHVSKSIWAEYLGFTSSMDVPDIYKGQQLILFNYMHGDRWFWIPLERDDYIKTFEHIRISAADIARTHKPDEKMTEEEERRVARTDDNTYFIEVDTKYHKRIRISTAGTDGETYRYFLEMDAKNHKIQIWDGEVDPDDPKKGIKEGTSNVIKIESEPKMNPGGLLKGRITLQNKAGATLILEGEDAKLTVPRDLTVSVGRNYVLDVEGSVGETIKGDKEVKILGKFKEFVKGIIEKTVEGLYTYFFKNARKEEIVETYDLAVAKEATFTAKSITSTIKKETILVSETYMATIARTYTVMGDVLTLTGKTAATMVSMRTATVTGAMTVTVGGGTATLSGATVMLAGKEVITSSPIKGCKC